jgi:hypothetical protein
LTCFTSTTSTNTVAESAGRDAAGGGGHATQFTCFTRTKVQILTQNLQDEMLRAEEDMLTEEISDAKQQV